MVVIKYISRQCEFIVDYRGVQHQCKRMTKRPSRLCYVHEKIKEQHDKN